jgi:CubicO group peptidase (beta-lactamase class C family)
MEKAVLESARRHGVIGGTVALVDSTTQYLYFGFANKERRLVPDADTIWDWGSITKLLCGVGALQLRDRGLLRLDDPAVKHYPELAKISGPIRSVTLEHLLTHTSGLQSGSTPEPLPPGAPYPTWPEFEASLPRLKMEAKPGERYAYSNLGLMIVGRIIERVAREDWEVYAQKNILMPLGMVESYFDRTPFHLVPRHAESYTAEGNPYGEDTDHGATTSNGGLKAPARDLVRFAQFILGRGPAILSRPSVEEMLRPRQIGDRTIGLAFHFETAGGRTLIGHSGGTAGYRAWLYLDPPRDRALIAAVNTDTGKAFIPEVLAAFAVR